MELGNLIFGHSRGTYPVPRGEWQDTFSEFLDKIGCDYHGYIDNNDPLVNERGGITTSLFEINPYYWGEDEAEMERPNFIFYPTGYEIRWCKYALRDAYANRQIDLNEFKHILDICARSVERERNKKQYTGSAEEYSCDEDRA